MIHLRDSALTEGGSWSWRRKYQRGRRVFLPPTRAVDIRHVLLLRMLNTWVSSTYLINIHWTTTIWHPRSLWCCVSWITLSTGCRRNDSVHGWQKIIPSSKSKISSFKGNVGIVNSKYRSQLTGQLIPFGRCGFQTIPHACGMPGPDYRVLLKASESASQETLWDGPK